MSKIDAKASPEVVSAQQLIEIGDMLNEMLKQMQTAGKGELAPLTLPVTAALQEVACSPPWRSFTVFNNGLNPVYMDVNRAYNAQNHTTPLNIGESLLVDYHAPRIERLFLSCLAGQNCVVRIFASR